MSILNQLVLKANTILLSGNTSRIINNNKSGTLDSLVSLFKKVECNDLKIDKNIPLTKDTVNNGGKVVFYYPLIENDKFTLAIFAFPPHTTIPIHDHPQMTVLSKVLYGSIKCSSFDWIDSNDKQLGKAKYIGTNILDENKVKITLPNEENIHQFQTGDQHSAVLDLLYPPYDHKFYRDCTYYKPISSVNTNNEISLKEYLPDFDCSGDPLNKELKNLNIELSKLTTN